MKILFTSVGRRVELIQAFRAAAEKEGENLQIHGADISQTAPALFFCDGRHIVPRITESGYIPALLEICQQETIDLVIPTTDRDLLLMAQQRETFLRAGTRILISDTDVVRKCRDKRETPDLFACAGLHAPKTYDNVGGYRDGFPAFIKPLDGSSSVNAYPVYDRQDLAARASQIKGYIIQPFIDGEEYTIDAFCDFDGNPIYITPRIRLATRSGEVSKTQIRNDPRIVEEVYRLINVMKPCGPITVQMIRERTSGTDWYIEINPRFGGGAPLSMSAGADSARAIVRLLRGKSVVYEENAAEDNALYCRYDQSIKITIPQE